MAASADGFGVLWAEEGGDHAGVRLLTLDPAGKPRGPATQIASTSRPGGKAAITAAPNGWAVAWSEDQKDHFAVGFLRTTANGQPIGAATTPARAINARPLALLSHANGFWLAWDSATKDQHPQRLDWLDSTGQATGKTIALREAPCLDPVVDLLSDAGRVLVGWEQDNTDGDEFVQVGTVDGQIAVQAKLDGSAPSLVKDGVFYTRLGDYGIHHAKLGKPVPQRVAEGQFPAATAFGPDTLLCYATPRLQSGKQELRCAVSAGGKVVAEQKVAEAADSFLHVDVAASGSTYAVAYQYLGPDGATASLAVVTCPAR